MKHIQLFEEFLNEAKLNTLTLSDEDAKSIWSQLIKANIKEGDTDNKSMRKDWEILKNHKGASIDKIRVYSRYTDKNLLLISFDIFPLDSKDREDYFNVATQQGVYIYATWNDGQISNPAFKNAWKMSNTESSKHTQSWFNTNGKILSK